MQNTLGLELKKMRGEKSLRQFSKEIGISHTHIDSIECGYDPRTGKPVNISVRTLMKIHKATGISIPEVVEGEDEQGNHWMGAKLRELREKRNYTQAELGEMIGKADSTVRAWELNKSPPAHAIINKLCMVLKTTPNEIYGFTPEESRSWIIDECDTTDETPSRAWIEFHCLNCGSNFGLEEGQYGWYAQESEIPFKVCPICAVPIKGRGGLKE